MGGGLILRWSLAAPFFAGTRVPATTCGISGRFQPLSPAEGQIIHLLLTRSPLYSPLRVLIARLACMKPAASVRSEPGSNSPIKISRKAKRLRRPRLPLGNEFDSLQLCYRNVLGYARTKILALTQVWCFQHTPYSIFKEHRLYPRQTQNHQRRSTYLGASCSSALPGDSLLTGEVCYHIFDVLSTPLFPAGPPSVHATSSPRQEQIQ